MLVSSVLPTEDVRVGSWRTAAGASGASGIPPVTRYARSGELNIAFQVLGEGEPDLVFVPGFVTNLELAWDWPALAAFQQALASFSRLIVFDKRGTGLSDRVREMPSTVERMDDLRAVMDEAGSGRAALLGVSEGATMAVAFAVAYPDRVSSLILYAPLPKAAWAPDYPWAEPEEWWDAVVERFGQSWGSPEYMQADAAWRAPSEAHNERLSSGGVWCTGALAPVRARRRIWRGSTHASTSVGCCRGSACRRW